MSNFKIAKCQPLQNLGSGSLELVICASQSTRAEGPESSVSTLLQTETFAYITKTITLGNCHKKCLTSHSHFLYWPPSGLMTVCTLAPVLRLYFEHCVYYFLACTSPLCLKYGTNEIIKSIKSGRKRPTQDRL